MIIPRKRKKSRVNTQLHIEGVLITPYDNVTIPAVPFNKSGDATTCIKRVKRQWNEGLKLLKAISSKAWRAQEELMRRLARALLVSKVAYGINYLRLAGKQETTLITMKRAAMRIVTGIPRFTTVEQLERAAQIIIVKKIAQEMAIIQEH